MSQTISPIRINDKRDPEVDEVLTLLTTNGSFDTSAALVRKMLQVFAPVIRTSPIFNLEAAQRSIGEVVSNHEYKPQATKEQISVDPVATPLSTDDGGPPKWNL